MKTIKHLSFALALAAAASSSFAAPETYGIDNNHTFPSFSYTHLGFSAQMSRFNKTTGKVVFDKAAKTGEVDITIDTTSVDTGSKIGRAHV